MTGTDCLRCGRPTADGFACVTCRDRATRDLIGDDSRDDRPGLVDTAPAARDIAHGLASGSGEGGASGKPESRLPLDLAVTAKLDAVQGEMTTWARHVAEERYSGPQGHVGEDPIVAAARYLAANVEWLRHRPEVDEAYAAIAACARVVRGIVRGPAAQRYLGPCGAPLIAIEPDVAAEHGIHPANAALGLAPCDGDVYARDGASTGRCRTCGAEVSTAERQAWLDGEVRQHAYTATEIADAYPIKANTIRQWLSRGLIVAHGEYQGRPLLNLGEVLDLAAADAARREEARADRARRAATKAAESEGAAA